MVSSAVQQTTSYELERRRTPESLLPRAVAAQEPAPLTFSVSGELVVAGDQGDVFSPSSLRFRPARGWWTPAFFSRQNRAAALKGGGSKCRGTAAGDFGGSPPSVGLWRSPSAVLLLPSASSVELERKMADCSNGTSSSVSLSTDL
nr:hypothetical protein Itr_chr07CG09690 [Ipomoea trifida]